MLWILCFELFSLQRNSLTKFVTTLLQFFVLMSEKKNFIHSKYLVHRLRTYLYAKVPSSIPTFCIICLPWNRSLNESGPILWPWSIRAFLHEKFPRELELVILQCAKSGRPIILKPLWRAGWSSSRCNASITTSDCTRDHLWTVLYGWRCP